METTIISAVAITISILGSVFAAVNHTRIRSTCCGKELSASLDVEKTTPQLTIKVPQ